VLSAVVDDSTEDDSVDDAVVVVSADVVCVVDSTVVSVAGASLVVPTVVEINIILLCDTIFVSFVKVKFYLTLKRRKTYW